MSLNFNKKAVIPIAIIVAIVLICTYFYFDPSDSALFPKCTFYSLTGLQCPGCGSQRARHARLFNAMMVVAPPVIVLLCVGECLRTKYPNLYLRLNSKLVIWTAFVVVTGWWILRNLL